MHSSPESPLLPLNDRSTDDEINRVMRELIHRSVSYLRIQEALWREGKRTPEAILHRLRFLLDP
jgi:hypothetical protein